MIRKFLLSLLILALAAPAFAQADPPPARILNDEGGAVAITGTLTYSNALFTVGVAQPIILLEDQAGFIDRDLGFLLPPASQVLGQLTSPFERSPVSYSLALPGEPQGSYRDVDNNGRADQGVQVYAVAYWNNIFGDPYLEERDLYGGGWSTAYASTRVSFNTDSLYEVIGGSLLVYAPDDRQGFPSGFGADGKLFTDDDPVVMLPAGYTVVNLDVTPFTFDRSRRPVIDLIEPTEAALDDFSMLSYIDAFDAMIDLLRREYAFTAEKNLDWDALVEEFRPRFKQASLDGDADAYARALRDLLLSIPDGHIAYYPLTYATYTDFLNQIEGGIGLAIRELDDGSVIVTYVTSGGQADRAGIQRGATLLSVQGQPTSEYIGTVRYLLAPFSTDHARRLTQATYAMRFPLRTRVEVTFQNPGADVQTAALQSVREFSSLDYAEQQLSPAPSGFRLPVEYRLLDGGEIVYVTITAFDDNEVLTVQLWERLMRSLNEQGVNKLIIDMRQNGGGSSWLADQMAAYLFNEPLIIGYSSGYNDSLGEFFVDTSRPARFYLPAFDLRYRGRVAVLIGPNCASACESFAYNLTLQDRAALVGMYPTAGLGGGINDFAMPEGIFVRASFGRNLDVDGNVIIEGTGVPPTIRVPVTAETVLTDGDPVLDAAIQHLGG